MAQRDSFLNPVPRSWGRRGLSKISSTATMVGLRTPANGLNLDIKPYALGSSSTNLKATPPYENDGNAEWGVDAKWGLTQTLIADLTYNTDFAQVEDDEAQVNLTRFSLFFPERRDFFLEGQDIFAFGGVGGGGGGGGPSPSNPTGNSPASAPPPEQHADPLLLAPHRAGRRPDRADPRRRPPARAHRSVQHRRAQHADRRPARVRQGGDELLGVPR